MVRGFSKSGETRGWRARRGEDQERGAPGPDPAPEEPRPHPRATGAPVPRSARQASRRAYLPPLRPAAESALPAPAARRRAGGDFKCSHPLRGTSPAHVTAAWRRPRPPRPDPTPLPEGAPQPLRPDGAVTAVLR